jgi:hypothetical protein
MFKKPRNLRGFCFMTKIFNNKVNKTYLYTRNLKTPKLWDLQHGTKASYRKFKKLLD